MLKTLEGIDEIGGVKIIRKRGELSWDLFDKKREEFPINITEEKNMISFKIQDGPIKEAGVNGCQVTTLIETAKTMIEYFVKKDEKSLTEMQEKIENGSFESYEESEELRLRYENMLTGYNCNKATVLCLAGAIHRQMMRTSDRELRGVEGTSEV